MLWTHPTLNPLALEKFPKDEFDLHYGPWAVVCGASEGIGLEWTYALAERGMNVVMISRNETQLKLAHEEISRAIPVQKYRAIAMNLGSVDEWRKLATALSKELEIGFVVYNAAYSPVGEFTAYPMNMHEQTINLNVHSPVIAVSAFAKQMVERKKGGIVLMSSADGEGCSPFVANYAGTKAWSTVFSEALWYEMRPHNVDVLGVVAGLTSTKSIDRVLDPKHRSRLHMIESSPRAVVQEALIALGKGQPIVITGLATKIVTWIRWFVPRSVGCSMLSGFKNFVKNPEALQKVAAETLTLKDSEVVRKEEL